MRSASRGGTTSLGSPYPHIYGPIDRAAVRGVSRVDRDGDGGFMGLTAT
jgi:uncharacterized protein (DUF952 family)